jgi:hypothetical protein
MKQRNPETRKLLYICILPGLFMVNKGKYTRLYLKVSGLAAWRARTENGTAIRQ